MFTKFLPFRRLALKFRLWDIQTECPIDAFPFETTKYLIKIGELFETLERSDFNEDTCLKTEINLSCDWKEFIINLETAKVAIVNDRKTHLPHSKIPSPYSAYELIHRHDQSFDELKRELVALGKTVENKGELKRSDERTLKPICEDINRIVSLLLEN
ncbi:hypothetical protein SM033_00159 [Vibrio phage vB_VpaM_sm033]|nr:hypothetical protein SM033_00159 [Vibrio phage vB_VpaM_sm033]